MALPEWNDYNANDSLPTWDSYNNDLPDWSDVENGKVDLDVIEEIESNGNNNAVSATGAKGLYQFMPDTAYQYSKRLFGKGTRDASTLTPEQQKAMANTYFNDLLKEFGGDVDKAIAAYNWGQGNVEKDIKEHGSAWEEYLPKETAKYENKYHRLSNTGSEHEGYEHQNYKYDDNKSAWENFEDFNHEQVQQMGDLWHGLTAEINKATGNEYSQDDIDTAKEALGTKQGKVLKTESAIAASVVAPELVPEIEGAALLGEEANLASRGAWLVNSAAKGAVGSMAFQGVENGKLTAKDTIRDTLTGTALEGGLHALVSEPVIKQVKTAFNKLVEATKDNPELTNVVKQYLGAARAEELGKNWKELRESNPNATLLDSYEHMAATNPDVWKSGAIEDVKPFVRHFKNNGSHTALINSARAAKNGFKAEAEALAKTDHEQRLIKIIADANEQIKGGVNISDDILPSTPLQKVGETLGDWFGADLPKAAKAKIAASGLKDEASALVKDLAGDNRRIGRELKKLNGKTGASVVAKTNALNAQRRLNNKMTEFINSGMQGKKVKVGDLQTAIKEVQEEQFNTGKFKGLTQRFKTLSDKMEAAQVHNIQEEKNIVSDIANHYGKKVATHAAVAYTGGLLTAGKLGIAATAVNQLAKAAKRGNLAYAKELVELVEAGKITPEQAESLIESSKSGMAKGAGRLGATLREAMANNND